MRIRERRFRYRRRLTLRLNRSNANRWGLFGKISHWWNRRKFYTFHKDEIITQKHTCKSPMTPNADSDDEVEWNNESESEDHEYSDTASKQEDKSSYAGSDLGEDDVGTLVTIEEETRFDDSLETIEEEVPLDESPRLGSKPKIMPLLSPEHVAPPFAHMSPAVMKTVRTTDSHSGSLESMDSLVSSQWDPEDDASTMTPLVTNIMNPTNDTFFVEHVRFLQIQTQPRKVEEVYHHDSKEKSVNE